MAHEHNPFAEMENEWREHKVYEVYKDLGHTVVDKAMAIRLAGVSGESSSNSDQDTSPTPFSGDFFRSLAEAREQ